MPKKGSDRGIYQRKGSPFWWIRWMTTSGMCFKSTHTTDRAQAQALLEDFRSAARRGEAPERGTAITVRELVATIESQTQHMASRATRASALKGFVAALGGRKVRSLTVADLEAWKSRDLASHAAGGAHYRLRLVRSVLRRGNELGFVPDAVVRAAGKVRRIRLDKPTPPYIPREKWDALLDELDGDLRVMVQISLFTGLRKSELLALRWSDVDRRAGVLVVRRGKGGKGRSVPLTEGAREALDIAGKVRRIGTDLLFPRPGKDEPRSDLNVEAFDAAQERAGVVPRVTWHGLRHSFASSLVAAGKDLRAVCDLMGHASITETMRYAHLEPSHLAEAIKVLDVPVRKAARRVG